MTWEAGLTRSRGADPAYCVCGGPALACASSGLGGVACHGGISVGKSAWTRRQSWRSCVETKRQSKAAWREMLCSAGTAHTHSAGQRLYTSDCGDVTVAIDCEGRYRALDLPSAWRAARQVKRPLRTCHAPLLCAETAGPQQHTPPTEMELALSKDPPPQKVGASFS